MTTQDGPEARNKLRNYHADGGLEILEEQFVNKLGPLARVLNRDKLNGTR